MQRKTRRSVQFEFTEMSSSPGMDSGSRTPQLGLRASESIRRLAPSVPRQDARIVHRRVRDIGLDSSSYRTHTMRPTKATLIYRRTKNLRAVQLLLGHSKLESTVRHLGIEVDDALEISEQTEA
jgi:integrase